MKSEQLQPLQCKTTVFDDISRTKIAKNAFKTDLPPECQKNVTFSLWAGPVKETVAPKGKKGSQFGPQHDGERIHFFALGTLLAPSWDPLAYSVFWQLATYVSLLFDLASASIHLYL